MRPEKKSNPLAYVFALLAFLFFAVAMCSTIENPLIRIDLHDLDRLLASPESVAGLQNFTILGGLNIFAVIALLLIAWATYPTVDRIFSAWWHPPRDQYTIDVEPGDMIVFVGRQTFKPTTGLFMIPIVLLALFLNFSASTSLFATWSGGLPDLVASFLAGATAFVTSSWLLLPYWLKNFLRLNNITVATLTRIEHVQLNLTLLGIFFRRIARPVQSTTPIEPQLEIFRSTNPGDLSGGILTSWPLSEIYPLLGSDNFRLISRDKEAEDILLHLQRGEFFADLIVRLKSEQLEIMTERETTRKTRIELRYGVHDLVRDEEEEWSPERGLAAENRLVERQRKVREHMRPGSSERQEVFLFTAKDPGLTVEEIFNPRSQQERGGVADYFRR